MQRGLFDYPVRFLNGGIPAPVLAGVSRRANLEKQMPAPPFFLDEALAPFLVHRGFPKRGRDPANRHQPSKPP